MRPGRNGKGLGGEGDFGSNFRKGRDFGKLENGVRERYLGGYIWHGEKGRCVLDCTEGGSGGRREVAEGGERDKGGRRGAMK